ncbi:MAG: hypothetical protein AAFX06_18400 [Planctomycetota bacterium]
MIARFLFSLLIASACLTVSAQQLTPEQQAEVQKMSGRFMAIQTLLQDAKAADEFGIDSKKRQKIQIAIQKFTDDMQKTMRNGGGGFDMDSYKKSYKQFMSKVDGELTSKQRAELTKRGEEQLKKFPGMGQNQDQMKEMQRLQSMMSELQKLSYDQALAESIDLTIEQRVEIREASQKFMRAMQEIRKPGQAFDMERYNQLIGDLVLEAQAILTLEQAEKMARNAKINQLKMMGGDVFSVVSGLAAEFELSDSETKDLKQTIVEARQDYYEKLTILREETLEKILRELPVNRREEVREALSDQLKPTSAELRGLPKPEKAND